MKRVFRRKRADIFAVYCLVSLVIGGCGLYGTIVDRVDWWLWSFLVALGASGLLVGLLFLADAIGILDRFIY